MIVNLSSVEQVKAVNVSQHVCCLLELCKSNGCAVDQNDVFWAVVHSFEGCANRLTLTAAKQRGWCSAAAKAA